MGFPNKMASLKVFCLCGVNCSLIVFKDISSDSVSTFSIMKQVCLRIV